MKLIQWIFAAAVLLMAACSSPATSGASQPAPAAVADLPRDVDARAAAQLFQAKNAVILDVREQDEWNAGHIPGALHIAMSEIKNRIKDIPTDKTVIVQCHSGNRSSQVTDFLRGQGMSNVHNLTGGIMAWQAAGLPLEK